MVKEDEYLLTNQEILGGLKTAVVKGQTLKQAMMSFYQAGYKKEEIEDAARAYLYLQRGNSEAEILAKNRGKREGGFKSLLGGEKKTEEEIKKEEEEVKEKKEGKGEKEKEEEEKDKSKQEKPGEKIISKVSKTQVPMSRGEKQKKGQEEVVQKISGYEGKKEPSKFKGKAVTSVLIIALVVLVGILALVFLFKAELIDFINGLFG